VLYSIRSERMLMEQLDYNLLFRWFVGLNMDDPVWVPTVLVRARTRGRSKRTGASLCSKRLRKKQPSFTRAGIHTLTGSDRPPKSRQAILTEHQTRIYAAGRPMRPELPGALGFTLRTGPRTERRFPTSNRATPLQRSTNRERASKQLSHRRFQRLG